MTKKKKMPSETSFSTKSETDKDGRPKLKGRPSREWMRIQKETEDKLRELEYENQNGYLPPKPWYED